MNLRELRLGNYVYVFNNQVAEVSAIGHDCWVDLLEPEEMQSQSQNPEKQQLTPIPLTEEWLVKFGAENLGKYFILDGLIIWVDIEKGTFYYRGTQIIVQLDFVHQFQNFYYVTYNWKELTIK